MNGTAAIYCRGCGDDERWCDLRVEWLCGELDFPSKCCVDVEMAVCSKLWSSKDNVYYERCRDVPQREGASAAYNALFYVLAPLHMRQGQSFERD